MGKNRGQKKSLQRFCYYYYCITGHLKIKSNFKTPVLRVALSGPYIKSHKGATLPAAGWHGATALPSPQLQHKEGLHALESAPLLQSCSIPGTAASLQSPNTIRSQPSSVSWYNEISVCSFSIFCT